MRRPPLLPKIDAMDDEEQQLTVAKILEPIYRTNAEWDKQIRAYEIMVARSLDPAERISLLHQIGELYELGGEQPDKAFEAVGRALMTQPKVLMLDEPTAGVSPIVMDELFDRIIEVARTGIAILMVEQNAKQALNIADKGYVLVQGRNRFTDTGAALLADPEVRKAFLGG